MDSTIFDRSAGSSGPTWGAVRSAKDTLMMLTFAFALILAATSAIAGTSVNVAYAGSLVTAMERSIGPQFMHSCDCTYNGEGRGSKALFRLIASGLRRPDVFISADPALMAQLLRPVSGPRLVTWYATFATSRIVIGYSRKSAFVGTIERAARGQLSLAALLEIPHLRIGRTDPQVDPKGARTLVSAQRLSQYFHDSNLTNVIQNAPIFPEEDLLVRLESGDLDVAFLYSVESGSRNIPALELPAGTSDGAIYAIAVLDHAENKAGATAFVRFILSGTAKSTLQRAGLVFSPLQISGDSKAAAASGL